MQLLLKTNHCLELLLTARGRSTQEASPACSLHIYRALQLYHHAAHWPLPNPEMAQVPQSAVKRRNKHRRTRTRGASQRGGGIASGKEQLKKKESQTLGGRDKETSRWFCLPDQDQVFLLKSFAVLPCKLCCGFKHRQTLPTAFPRGRPHLQASRRPCAPLTLAHFLRSEKWWHFSKVISNNLCVWCVPVCVWKQPYLLFRPNYF